MRFNRQVLANDPERRETVLSVLEAALDAVDPAAAVSRTIGFSRREVQVGASSYRPRGVMMVAVGKAAPAMARAARQALSPLPVRGIVVSDHQETIPDGLDLHVSSHPLPDDRSVVAGLEAMQLVSSAGPEELVLFLVSGGGSALLEVPAGGLPLDDLIVTQRAMLLGGVTIEEMNAVRRHLSAIKGGRLAAACSSRFQVTLLVSDVSGQGMDVIASGPTLPDPSTYSDALEVLEVHHLAERIPRPVIDHLQTGARGLIEETPKEAVPGRKAVVVADGGMAARAALTAAGERGLSARLATTTMAGEAVAVATEAVSTSPHGIVTLMSGETTVHVTGGGVGGRNQEAALAAAISLGGDSGAVFASLGTDGIDGPTDAAGALVDGGTVDRGERKGLAAGAYLAANNSHPYLEATGDLLRTGPTGTNVGDIWLIWKE